MTPTTTSTEQANPDRLLLAEPLPGLQLVAMHWTNRDPPAWVLWWAYGGVPIDFDPWWLGCGVLS